jgi:hypothetical protein
MKRQNRKTKRHSRFVAPRTLEQFSALSERDQERWIRVTHVPTIMRRDRVSLTKAAQQAGVDRRTALALGRSGFRKRSGRYKPTRNDHILRPVVIPTREGQRVIALRDWRKTVLLAEYWNAVQKYLETGDASALEQFRGMHITDAVGTELPLLTDLDELNRLGNAGSLSFESLYARSA